MVRKLDANTQAHPGYLRVLRAIKTISGGAGARAHTCPENCMTLHDAEARPNLHSLSSPATLGES